MCDTCDTCHSNTLRKWNTRYCEFDFVSGRFEWRKRPDDVDPNGFMMINKFTEIQTKDVSKGERGIHPQGMEGESSDDSDHPRGWIRIEIGSSVCARAGGGHAGGEMAAKLWRHPRWNLSLPPQSRPLHLSLSLSLIVCVPWVDTDTLF